MIIHRDSILKETVPHGSDGFPIGFYRTDTYAYQDHLEYAHWHPEFQFVCVVKNELRCLIGQEEIPLREGEGLFINSGTLHGFTAREPCLMKEIIFHADLIDTGTSDIFQIYIKPFLEGEISHLRLVPERENDVRMLELIRTMVDLSDRGGELWKIREKRLALELWELLYRERERCETIEQTGLTRTMMIRFKLMTDFIAAHYREELSLAQIAAAAGISKTEANRCFQQMARTSPVSWMIRLRLQKAAQLLDTTADPVALIAARAGFDDSNYFSRAFKKEFACSPREYRTRQGLQAVRT